MNHSPQASDTQSAATLRRSQVMIILLSLALVGVDFYLGPDMQVPIFYIIPVILGAWRVGAIWACVLAVFLAIARFFCHLAWDFPVEFMPAIVNNLMRGAVLLVVAFLTAKIAKLVRDLRLRVEQLESRLPVCRSCGLIHDSAGKWVPLDSLDSSHQKNGTTCPDCEEKRYGAYS